MQHKTIITDIRAVPLKPGDILVVHSTGKLDADQKRLLEHELTKTFWGKPNTFVIVQGNFKLAAVTPVQPEPTCPNETASTSPATPCAEQK